MTFAQFRDAPWANSHEAYSKARLAMTPAPEYASSEVILSSVYRVIGLEGATERTVPQSGRDLDRAIKRARERGKGPDRSTLDPDSFSSLLGSILESPKLPNQSTKRFLQVMPLVPQLSVFSGSARLAGNPWTAGQLVKRMVWLGSSDSAAAEAIWRAFFEALSVGNEDDVFARFLQAEVEAWVPKPNWHLATPRADPVMARDDASIDVFPARQFVHDVRAVIAAKSAMTRRQWTSLLEAVIRLGAVAHVVWLCEVHSRAWIALSSALDGEGPEGAEASRVALYPERLACLPYGNKALPSIRDSVSRFLAARLGINTTLWALDSLGIAPADGLSSSHGLAELCDQVRANRTRLEGTGVRDVVASLEDRETRTLLCRKGIGSNINEFVRHVLGQRQTANPTLRGYDQGYVLKKAGASANSPWIVSLGPVAVLALVHCSLAGVGGPRSVHRLAQHLAQYGVSMAHRDIPQNDLGQQLRMLGLVLDSPDAESGMLLVPPFRLSPVSGRGQP
ncbi:hypothetical protein Mesau_05996 [Mesorhizobium australicum WSM2073]|uniref:Uncharacterized protein n=1 Tax=Mesorhizobium australicum (strain HAMBI 3006 / LMG 24608 / WSM2073) TaxID=754035 RepID=L0KSX5_MESAW|nr:hypothetical protein [Mesorhizobium australicum]AGB48216.1 hypothetical protein Mesau_05996 [Mesorhizobium australicum WSM2073]